MEKLKLTENLIKNIKKVQKMLLEKSQSNEWVESARAGWLEDIKTLQSALYVIEKL